MARLRQFFQRLFSTVRPDRDRSEVEREIAAHLRLLEDQFLAEGKSLEEARFAARRALGGVDQIRERHRDARSFAWIDDLRRDAIYAARSLRRTPAFTIASILTLAVGIGATTAIYSVVDTVLLRPLPFRDSDRLVRIAVNDVRGVFGINFFEYLDWRPRTKTITNLAAGATNFSTLIQTRQGTARLSAGFVSPNYFELLGARTVFGRTIVTSDEANPDVVVISFDTWHRYFGGSEHTLGTVMELRNGPLAGHVMTIVGILPESTANSELDLDIYVPLVASPKDRPIGVAMFGRLAPGVSMAAALEEAEAIGRTFRPIKPETKLPADGHEFSVVGVKDRMVRTLRPALQVFLVAVGVVLVIVCANLANLLLARGTSREREIAVRLAIGASRGRIVRQILAECLVLTAAGGALGVLIAAAGVALVKTLAFIDAPGVFRLAYGSSVLPRAAEIGVDARMLGTALAIAAVTGVVFSVLPALQLSRTNQLQAMGTRGIGVSHRATRVRTVLVVGQLVMATILLVAAGLLARSFVSLATTEKGYDVRQVLGFNLVLPTEYSTERKAQTIAAILDRLRARTGVVSAGFSYSGVLLGIEDWIGTIVPPGRTLDELKDDPLKPRVRAISPGYFKTMGIRVIDGRDFTASDNGAAAPVIAIDRAMAKKYFGDTNPLGSTVDWHTDKAAPIQLTIVAVVDDVKNGSVSNAAKPQIYVDYRQMLELGRRWGLPNQGEGLAFGFMSFSVRTQGDPSALIPVVRAEVREVDQLAGIDAILPLERLLGATFARQRFYAVILGVFALVATALAAIGIYGVLAYAVIQRTQEMGIRLALGARRRQVLALVLRRGLVLTVIGLTLGLIGAAAGSKYLQALLFGVQPLDVPTFAGVAVGFLTIAMIASFFPARRATQVDPVVALRAE